MFLIVIFAFIVLFLYIFIVDIPVLLQLSFVANLALNLFITLKLFRQKKFNPLMCTSIIFMLCFFLIAPLVQLHDDFIAPNKYVIKVDIAIYTNFLIFIFYLILYAIQKKSGLSYKGWYYGNLKRINKLLLIISITSLVIALPFLKSIYIAQASDLVAENSSILETLVIRKVILSFPFFCMLAFLSTNQLKIGNLGIFLILLLLLFIAKNPLLEKRNAIGPIYLTLLYVFFSKNLNNNIKFYISNLILFVVFFPLSSLLTHSANGSTSAIRKLEMIEAEDVDLGVTILHHFNELHYDAWSMINATVEYTSLDGLTLGRQFLGAILFFFPRALWENKPIGSGSLVGEEFISNLYGFNFFNLSSPFIAEGYINFGFLGVVLFSILLGYLFVWGYKKLQDNRYDFLLIIYTSFYMFFLLRGDLQNAIAYYVGPLVAFLLIRFIILRQKNRIS